MLHIYQQGAVSWLAGLIFLGLAVVVALVLLSTDAADDLQREAEITALDRIGQLAAKRLDTAADASSVDASANQGSAVDMISRPIEVVSVTKDIVYASGVGNTVLVATDEGNVVFDTGLIIQSAQQLRALQAAGHDEPARYVVLSHSHADHVGGAKLWRTDGTQLVAHEEFLEEQRYLTELDPYFHGRNRTLFPWMPAEPSSLGLLNYRGLQPDIEVDNEEPYRFTLGGKRFEVIAVPGAEGADNIVLWLPDEKVLLSGDFFGPQFPQFPNVFTMRGEKVRKPIEYVHSLNRLLALEPEIIVPSHLSPVMGADAAREGMTRIRDAVQFVHDATVAGMNAGKSVETLMQEITLPEELALSQTHGKVSWAVRSIWEYYATWFHFRNTTELYAVPIDAVFTDVAALATVDKLTDLAKNYLSEGSPEKALHALDLTASESPEVLAVRRSALETLLARAEANEKNDYEIYWLRSRLRATNATESRETALAENSN